MSTLSNLELCYHLIRNWSKTNNKVLQTHVHGCAYLTLCNGSIRLRNTQTLNQLEKTQYEKHLNTSLIRSSPNTPGLRLLVYPSVVASLLCFQRKVFTTVSSIWVSLNRYKSARLYLDSPSLWSTQTLLTETRPLLVTVVWQAYAEEFSWTSQAFSGVHRLSDSL